MIDILTATLICTGIAPTHPVTNIEVEIRPQKYSTIRYEFAEGSLAGTAYVQSLGSMPPSHRGSVVTFKSGNGELSTRLVVKMRGNHILESHFRHHISGMKDAPVDCVMEAKK